MKQPKTESVTVSFRLSAETLALLDAHAAAEKRTRANLIELIVTTEMALRDKLVDKPEFPHGEFDNGNHWKGK